MIIVTNKLGIAISQLATVSFIKEGWQGLNSQQANAILQGIKRCEVLAKIASQKGQG
jgi:hypothetical protein